MYKKAIIFLLTVSFLTSSYHLVARAASPSPSPSPSPTPVSDDTVTDNLKKRLQETLRGETATPSATSYKSFVGVIRDVIKNTLIIEDKDGKKNVMIKDAATLVRSPGNATIKAENIRIDDYVIAIGNLKESDELEAVRVIVSTEPLSTSAKQAAAAKITKITKSALTLAPLTGGEAKVVTLNSKTKYKTSLGESLELADLVLGDSLIYTALEGKDNALTATSIMRIGFADPDASPSPLPSPAE